MGGIRRGGGVPMPRPPYGRGYARIPLLYIKLLTMGGGWV